MTSSAHEHFEWSRERALEYVSAGDGGQAMSSLITDLANHPDTERILTTELQMLFMGEVLVGGAEGARRFIEALRCPQP